MEKYFGIIHEVGKRIKLPNYTIDRLPFMLINQDHKKEDSIEIKEKWVKFLRKVPKNHTFDLYINIPYCAKKCNYCQEVSKPLCSGVNLKKYVGYLKSNIIFFRNTFKNVLFKNLYVGGGTPNILTKNQIKETFECLFNNFDFDEKPEKTFEFNPALMDKPKLKCLKDLGFNRLSMGVQSLNKDVLDYENRGYQKYEHIKRIVEIVRTLKFENFNFDLILGLKKDNLKRFKDTFEKCLSLKPESITLTRLNPTEKYLEKNYNKDKKLFYKEYNKRFFQAKPEIEKLLNEFGYSSKFFFINSMQYVFSKKTGNYFNYKYENCYPYSCLGIGKYAKSKIFGKYRITNDELSEDLNVSNKIYSVNRITPIFELYLYVFKLLARNEKINLEELKNLFGTDVFNKFDEEIQFLKRLKQVNVHKGFMSFSTKEQKSRFFYSLLLFKKDIIIRKYIELKNKN